jgi:hypothetical protein
LELSIRKLIKRKDLIKDDKYGVLFSSLGIFVLFWISVVVVYVAPIGDDKIVFIVLLLLFWFTKMDYFWFAFFIIIALTPGGFFTETTNDAVRRLPLFTIFPKASFSVFDLFLIVSLMKAIFKGRSQRFGDALKLKNIFYFLIYILVVSIFHGFSVASFIRLPLRGLFFYSFMFTFPALIYNKKDTFKFLCMFLPFVFIELVAQIYLLTEGQYLVTLFNSEIGLTVFRDKLMGNNIRSIAIGYSIVMMSFIFCLVMMDSEKRIVPKSYLILILILSSISVMISATRQTILMFGFMFILYILFVTRSRPGFIIQIFFISLGLFVLLDLINVIDLNSVFGASFDRLTGAIQYQNGTVTTEDTLDARLVHRLPLLLEHIKGSIFLGYGFSDVYYEYHDGHLGGILVGLLQAGLIGYMFYIAFIYNVYRKGIYYVKKFGRDIPSVVTIKALLIAVSGMVFVNAFIDPEIMLNFFAKPQEFFILLVLISQFINFGKMEYIQKRRKLHVRQLILNNKSKITQSEY